MKLLSLYLFALLATTAKSLTCHDSTAPDTPLTCKAPAKQCYLQQEEYNLDGSVKKNTLQTCVESCEGVNVGLTFGDKKYYKLVTTCCDKDNCNVLPKEPSTNTSNLECPACFAFSSTYCNATWIKCPKSEDQCMNVTGVLLPEKTDSPIQFFYGRGCTTVSAETIVLDEKLKENKFKILAITMEKAKDSSLQLQGSFMLTLLLSGLIGIQLTNVIS